MAAKDDPAAHFAEGLHELPGFTFPLTCGHCGKTYPDLAAFLKETGVVDHFADLVESSDSEQHRVLELLRSCPCGHLLLEEFDDRRDHSPAGNEVRSTFSRLLRQLRRQGISREEAHNCLLDFLHRRGREALENLKVA